MKVHKKGFAPLADINVTPLVDVMLVLLIIFMVTAPMMQQGLEVDLPTAKGKGFSKETGLVISITKDKKIYLGKEEKTDIGSLPAKLKDFRDAEVLIKADAGVPYGFVVRVMAGIKDAGVERVGMVTNPEE